MRRIGTGVAVSTAGWFLFGNFAVRNVEHALNACRIRPLAVSIGPGLS
jgi:hypothetical protein